MDNERRINEDMALACIEATNNRRFFILGIPCRCDSIEDAIRHQVSICSMTMIEQRRLESVINEFRDLLDTSSGVVQ